MVDTQHFCLRWNNYQSSITSAFENLRDDEDFVDVTLACDGKSLKAHRVVLSACSPYFRELLKSTPCKHPVIVLQDVAFTDLHALVEFIYHGEVNVHQRSLSSFLKTAEVLRVSGLTQQHGEDRDITQVQQQTNSRFGISNQQTQSPHTLNNDEVSSPGNNGNPVRRPSATRRERRGSTEQQISENELKRSRHDHNLNNNMPEQLTPTDFSPTAMKNTVNSVLQKHDGQSDGHGNGVESPSRSPPPSVGIQRPNNNDDDNVKHEPMDASLDLDNNSNDSTGGGTLKKGPPSSCSAGDHDDHDSPLHPAFLTPSESKLFATAAGSFNFSMAALAGDPTGLAGLGSQALQNTADNLAGTSQGGMVGAMMAGGGAHRCNVCGKALSTRLTLKRHTEQQHLQPLHSSVCTLCHKVFRTLNSLNNHKSIYHRRQK